MSVHGGKTDLAVRASKSVSDPKRPLLDRGRPVNAKSMFGQELQRDLVENVRILSLHTVSRIRYHHRCRKLSALPHFIVKELKFLWTFIRCHEQHWKIKLLDVGARADRAAFVPQR